MGESLGFFKYGGASRENRGESTSRTLHEGGKQSPGPLHRDPPVHGGVTGEILGGKGDPAGKQLPTVHVYGGPWGVISTPWGHGGEYQKNTANKKHSCRRLPT